MRKNINIIIIIECKVIEGQDKIVLIEKTRKKIDKLQEINNLLHMNIKEKKIITKKTKKIP